jgi:hypothetical protein
MPSEPPLEGVPPEEPPLGADGAPSDPPPAVGAPAPPELLGGLLEGDDVEREVAQPAATSDAAAMRMSSRARMVMMLSSLGARGRGRCGFQVCARKEAAELVGHAITRRALHPGHERQGNDRADDG